MTFRLVGGDAIQAMQAMAENSVDAIVTDPPYGLEFMGKEWDTVGRRTNHHMDPSMQITRSEPEKGNPWASEASGYGAPKKNPRCKRCGRLKFDHEPRRCACETPDFDTRTSEYARTMQAWHHAWATEALRILKPGGHLLAFGGTRTYHRLACAIEDAGFEIRDCLAWLYGSGFPKSLNIGDGMGTALKPAFEPIVLARKPLAERNVAANVQRWGTGALNVDGCRIGTSKNVPFGRPSKERGSEGWGMAEPDEESGGRDPNLGRWPANVTLDADAARMLDEQTEGMRAATPAGSHARVQRGDKADSPSLGKGWGPHEWAGHEDQPAGRWPANVTLDETAAAMLDEQTGERTSGSRAAGDYGRLGGHGRYSTWDEGPMPAIEGDTGGASRFFYCPKADREERNRGLGHMAPQRAYTHNIDGRDPLNPSNAMGGAERQRVERGEPGIAPSANHHPTVKPVELMRWLCRMVTPKGGTVLDPFTGSGSTGVAAMREGFEFIGIEREAEYVEIARARIFGDSPLFNVEVGGPTE